MIRLKKLAVLALALGLCGAAGADTLDMQGSDANKGRIGPRSGVTQQSVEAAYGAPIAKKAAVGDPPISSWEYDTFIVYFEYDRVIHAVKKRK